MDEPIHVRVVGMALVSGLDQARAGVNASEGLDTRLEEWAGEHALAAAEVDDVFVGLGVEVFQDGGEDDVAMVVRASIANEFIIPLRNRVPALLGGRRAGWF